MTHAASKPPVDPALRAMSAETMKMPEPIIDPTTIVVESNKPKPRTKPEVSASGWSVVATWDFVSDTELLPFYFGGPQASQETSSAKIDRAPDYAPWGAAEAATSSAPT